MTGLPAVLAPFRDHPATAALFVDFDGTLAPIVEDPAAARPFSGVPELLVALAGRFGLVAVVSGRPVRFLQDVLGQSPGVHLAGLYGMEEVGTDGVRRAAGPA
ncbi:MAG TPA: trehalose-phosphatase, partial [Acidimicrobiales bacterium]|nr:trehalose-phosphatase [Acidimicrobiales bacterium]